MKWFLLIILLVVCIYFYYYRQKLPDKIICPPGSIGEYCQYNNSDFCFDRGDVLLNKNNEPFCKCFGNFGGKNCETCKDGYAGNSCEFSSKEFCKDRGTVAVNRDNRPYCLTCEHPFDGINCQKCKPGYAGINCNYTDSYCSDSTGTIRGKVYTDSSGNPKCDCFSSFFGNKCQYTTSSRCNYRGRYDAESDTCFCMDEYYGNKCEYIHKEECGENGLITYIDYDSTPPRVTCTCNTYKGYYGSKCQFNEKQQCRGRGRLRVEYISKRVDNKEIIEEKAVCDCSGNFTGNNCSECKDGFYSPEYDCKYSNASCNTTNFNTPGSTVTLPPNRLIYDNITKKLSCACYKGDEISVNKEGKQSGSRCQFLDSELCNKRGYVERIIDEKSNPPKVKCTCEDPLIFTGNKCECKAGLKGDKCQYSDEKTCNNRGVVDNSGNCTCLDGYTGVNCSNCSDDNDLGFYTPDNKFFCVAKDFCTKKGLVGKTPSQIYTDGSVRCS